VGLDRRKAGPLLTQQLEDQVQSLLDQIHPPADRSFGGAAAAAGPVDANHSYSTTGNGG